MSFLLVLCLFTGRVTGSSLSGSDSSDQFFKTPFLRKTCGCILPPFIVFIDLYATSENERRKEKKKEETLRGREKIEE